jgi:hypothetical protein
MHVKFPTLFHKYRNSAPSILDSQCDCRIRRSRGHVRRYFGCYYTTEPSDSPRYTQPLSGDECIVIVSNCAIDRGYDGTGGQ